VCCRPALVGKTIHILVGPDKKKYTIHETVLIHHSEYFRNVLRDPSKQAGEGVIPLEDVEVETCTSMISSVDTKESVFRDVIATPQAIPN
jgi:hypothetical protein